jgi:hypothetical protein
MKISGVSVVARALMLMCGFVASACGGSTTGPSDTPLNLAGTWTGTWTFVSGGATVTDTVTMTVTQNDTSAGGQWSGTGNVAGTVAFTPAASFTGTASISQTLIIGGNCSATTTLTGTASANQIRFTLGTLAPVNLCQWATSHTFTFSR